MAVGFVSFCTTIGGMLVFALMFGTVSDKISSRVNNFKEGKSRVIDSIHTLMLGWNDKSFAIIEQMHWPTKVRVAATLLYWLI
eukprot:5918481-Ditylum_brightwellii.AAC.1